MSYPESNGLVGGYTILVEMRTLSREDSEPQCQRRKTVDRWPACEGSVLVLLVTYTGAAQATLAPVGGSCVDLPLVAARCWSDCSHRQTPS